MISFLRLDEETKAEDVSKKDNVWNSNLFLKVVEAVKNLLGQKPMAVLNLEEAILRIQEMYHRECITADTNREKIL